MSKIELSWSDHYRYKYGCFNIFKDNHANIPKIKYINFPETCPSYSIIFGLFRNKVKSHAGKIFSEI